MKSRAQRSTREGNVGSPIVERKWKGRTRLPLVQREGGITGKGGREKGTVATCFGRSDRAEGGCKSRKGKKLSDRTIGEAASRSSAKRKGILKGEEEEEIEKATRDSNTVVKKRRRPTIKHAGDFFRKGAWGPTKEDEKLDDQETQRRIKKRNGWRGSTYLKRSTNGVAWGRGGQGREYGRGDCRDPWGISDLSREEKKKKKKSFSTDSSQQWRKSGP